MAIDKYPSKLLEQATAEFSKLPGVGNKTALRFVLHLLRQDAIDIERFGNIIMQLKKSIKYCTVCCNISDHDTCEICADHARDRSTICVVENIKDVIAVEQTHMYKGVYHVLGGIISPMDGVGPDDLTVGQLEKRVAAGDINEVIFALSTTIEGDTTNFYLFRKLSIYNIKMTTLARGVSVGNELEYTDEVTLGRSIMNRVHFDPVINKKHA